MPGEHRPVTPRKRIKERTATTMLLAPIDPVRPCSVEHERAQSLGGIGVGIIADSIEQVDKDSLIDVECCLSHSTVLSHPRTEFSQYRPQVTGGWWRHRKRQFTLVLKKPDEH
jgi:hypothetical protein